LGAWLYPVVLGLVLGLLELSGRALGVAGRTAAVFAGAKVAWPAILGLGLLPVADRLPQVAGGHGAALIALSATLGLAFRIDRKSRTRIPVVAAPLRDRGPWPGVWEVALLGVCLVVSVLYLRIGAAAEGNFQNDSAYYFGVARHIAMTGRLEEPIVWHFVNPPAALVHAPFDYWGGLTSVVLAPILAVFGPTEQVAFIAMAGISALSVIAFWYLVCIALPIRYAVLQLLALLSFAFSASAHAYRFDTESLPLYHLMLTIAVIGLATDRPRLAVVGGFLLALCRIDGMALYMGIGLLVVVRLQRQGRTPELRRAGLLAGGLLATYLLRNLWSFGSLMPPGSATAVLLKDQVDLYALHRPATPTFDALLARFRIDYLMARLGLLVDTLRALPLVPAQPLFFLLGVLPGVCYFRKRVGASVLVPGAK